MKPQTFKQRDPMAIVEGAAYLRGAANDLKAEIVVASVDADEIVVKLDVLLSLAEALNHSATIIDLLVLAIETGEDVFDLPSNAPFRVIRFPELIQ